MHRAIKSPGPKPWDDRGSFYLHLSWRQIIVTHSVAWLVSGAGLAFTAAVVLGWH